jgi:predicted NAD/FAD-binding protein
MQTEVVAMRLAIIGGGVSGLSSAYYLLEQAQPGDRPLHIDIYERKSTLGGNADTVVVDLGDFIDADGARQAYLRWADLGVNDVNLTTYVELKKIMEKIGYLDKMKPLQDTACYFNNDGSLALTDDAALREGVSDGAFSIDSADDGLLAPLITVVHHSALNLLAEITPQYTVGQFFDDCLARPEAMLSQAASQLKIVIDWCDPQLAARIGRVRDAIYYPRIAAMYFTDENGPETLPLQSPFAYYQLQEGQGKDTKPDRRYFAHGAQKWLEALAAYLLSHSSDVVSIRLHTDAGVKVDVEAGQVTVRGPGRLPAQYDMCVLATHADDTLALLNFGVDMRDFGQHIGAILSKVRYTRGYAVCHTYGGVMPQNKNIWRTYNVLQRNVGDSSFPYRMTYVCNLHQNDPLNPDYAHAGLPLFLVSLVKSLNDIPYQAMLDRVRDTRRINPRMLAELPRATQRQLQGELLRSGLATGNAPSRLANKAWTVFKHNVLDAECIASQQEIQDYNEATAIQIADGRQPVCSLLFAGGWTIGAGLHEQCLVRSAMIAGAILPALREGLIPAEESDPVVAARAA